MLTLVDLMLDMTNKEKSSKKEKFYEMIAIYNA